MYQIFFGFLRHHRPSMTWARNKNIIMCALTRVLIHLHCLIHGIVYLNPNFQSVFVIAHGVANLQVLILEQYHYYIENVAQFVAFQNGFFVAVQRVILAQEIAHG